MVYNPIKSHEIKLHLVYYILSPQFIKQSDRVHANVACVLFYCSKNWDITNISVGEY